MHNGLKLFKKNKMISNYLKQKI